MKRILPSSIPSHVPVPLPLTDNQVSLIKFHPRLLSLPFGYNPRAALAVSGAELSSVPKSVSSTSVAQIKSVLSFLANVWGNLFDTLHPSSLRNTAYLGLENKVCQLQRRR